MITLIVVLSLCSHTIISLRVHTQSDYSWPMFGYDSQHSGYTESPAPESNILLWTFNASASISSPVIANGKIYFGSNNFYLYCLDAFSGSLLWEYETNGQNYESPAVFDRRIYFGSDDGYVYCLYSDTGELSWKTQIGDLFSHIIIPTVSEGKVYVGKLHKQGVYCLNAENGIVIWINEDIHSLEIGVAVSDFRVYVPADNRLYCLSSVNGTIIWVNESVFGYSCPTVANGKVYLGTLYGKVYCCDAETGNQLWEYETNGLVPSSPATAYGRVFVGSKDDFVYCLNAANGSLIWRYETEGAVQSSPAVADGKVYVGSNDHYLYCLDAFTGELLWRYETNYHIAQSPAVANNIVYIAPRRTMYAISESEVTPPNGAFTDIPGFPLEAIFVGLITVALVLTLKRKSTDSLMK